LEKSPEIDDVVVNSDVELANNTYDKYIGDGESLTDRKGVNLMAKIMKKTISNDKDKTSGTYNPRPDHSSYEIQF